ncbi:MAG: 3-deoxy-7-phosphoheptulonate synthase [Myxococcales bacterium]|nr:3-deoxy-7-phosphoheptulonate synthase [Myxococcales bacterium]
MIVSLEIGSDASRVERELVARGLWVRRLDGAQRVSFLIEPSSRQVTREELLQITGVQDVAQAKSPHPLLDAQPRQPALCGLTLGREPLLIAGPCAVESPAQIEAIAARIAAVGARLIRGGAFKPRTSPYSFQGQGERALGWLSSAAHKHGLGVVTEVMAPEQAKLVAEHADLVQIGCRNMQNYSLLASAAALQKPMLLKRGMSATVEEWLLAAEYCLLHGAPFVVFCERGIRGFDSSTRNLLDLGSVALLSHVHGLPVLVDPSHACGRRDLIPALSRAAVAVGAAGLLLETHDAPGDALSDGPQALSPAELEAIAGEMGVRRPTAIERPQVAPRLEART